MRYLAINIFSQIYQYSTIDTRNAVIFIGGTTSGLGFYNLVAKFQSGQWSRLPNLQQARYGHGSIRIGREIINAGGRYVKDT